MGEAERGEAAPRNRVGFWCANGHESRIAFAADIEVPETWDCPRSDADGDALLEEALTRLRARRGA
jgi:hypothetical protein